MEQNAQIRSDVVFTQTNSITQIPLNTTSRLGFVTAEHVDAGATLTVHPVLDGKPHEPSLSVANSANTPVTVTVVRQGTSSSREVTQIVFNQGYDNAGTDTIKNGDYITLYQTSSIAHNIWFTTDVNVNVPPGNNIPVVVTGTMTAAELAAATNTKLNSQNYFNSTANVSLPLTSASFRSHIVEVTDNAVGTRAEVSLGNMVSEDAPMIAIRDIGSASSKRSTWVSFTGVTSDALSGRYITIAAPGHATNILNVWFKMAVGDSAPAGMPGSSSVVVDLSGYSTPTATDFASAFEAALTGSFTVTNLSDAALPNTTVTIDDFPTKPDVNTRRLFLRVTDTLPPLRYYLNLQTDSGAFDMDSSDYTMVANTMVTMTFSSPALIGGSTIDRYALSSNNNIIVVMKDDACDNSAVATLDADANTKILNAIDIGSDMYGAGNTYDEISEIDYHLVATLSLSGGQGPYGVELHEVDAGTGSDMLISVDISEASNGSKFAIVIPNYEYGKAQRGYNKDVEIYVNDNNNASTNASGSFNIRYLTDPTIQITLSESVEYRVQSGDLAGSPAILNGDTGAMFVLNVDGQSNASNTWSMSSVQNANSQDVFSIAADGVDPTRAVVSIDNSALDGAYDLIDLDALSDTNTDGTPYIKYTEFVRQDNSLDYYVGDAANFSAVVFTAAATSGSYETTNPVQVGSETDAVATGLALDAGTGYDDGAAFDSVSIAFRATYSGVNGNANFDGATAFPAVTRSVDDTYMASLATVAFASYDTDSKTLTIDMAGATPASLDGKYFDIPYNSPDSLSEYRASIYFYNGTNEGPPAGASSVNMSVDVSSASTASDIAYLCYTTIQTYAADWSCQNPKALEVSGTSMYVNHDGTGGISPTRDARSARDMYAAHIRGNIVAVSDVTDYATKNAYTYATVGYNLGTPDIAAFYVSPATFSWSFETPSYKIKDGASHAGTYAAITSGTDILVATVSVSNASISGGNGAFSLRSFANASNFTLANGDADSVQFLIDVSETTESDTDLLTFENALQYTEFTDDVYNVQDGDQTTYVYFAQPALNNRVNEISNAPVYESDAQYTTDSGLRFSAGGFGKQYIDRTDADSALVFYPSENKIQFVARAHESHTVALSNMSSYVSSTSGDNDTRATTSLDFSGVTSLSALDGKYVTMYVNASSDTVTFWLQQSGSATAPSVSGELVEVNITGSSTVSDVLEAVRAEAVSNLTFKHAYVTVGEFTVASFDRFSRDDTKDTSKFAFDVSSDVVQWDGSHASTTRLQITTDSWTVADPRHSVTTEMVEVIERQGTWATDNVAEFALTGSALTGGSGAFAIGTLDDVNGESDYFTVSGSATAGTVRFRDDAVATGDYNLLNSYSDTPTDLDMYYSEYSSNFPLRLNGITITNDVVGPTLGENPSATYGSISKVFSESGKRQMVNITYPSTGSAADFSGHSLTVPLPSASSVTFSYDDMGLSNNDSLTQIIRKIAAYIDANANFYATSHPMLTMTDSNVNYLGASGSRLKTTLTGATSVVLTQQLDTYVKSGSYPEDGMYCAHMSLEGVTDYTGGLRVVHYKQDNCAVLLTCNDVGAASTVDASSVSGLGVTARNIRPGSGSTYARFDVDFSGVTSISGLVGKTITIHYPTGSQVFTFTSGSSGVGQVSVSGITTLNASNITNLATRFMTAAQLTGNFSTRGDTSLQNGPDVTDHFMFSNGTDPTVASSSGNARGGSGTIDPNATIEAAKTMYMFLNSDGTANASGRALTTSRNATSEVYEVHADIMDPYRTESLVDGNGDATTLTFNIFDRPTLTFSSFADGTVARADGLVNATNLHTFNATVAYEVEGLTSNDIQVVRAHVDDSGDRTTRAGFHGIVIKSFDADTDGADAYNVWAMAPTSDTAAMNAADMHAVVVTDLSAGSRAFTRITPPVTAGAPDSWFPSFFSVPAGYEGASNRAARYFLDFNGVTGASSNVIFGDTSVDLKNTGPTHGLTVSMHDGNGAITLHIGRSNTTANADIFVETKDTDTSADLARKTAAAFANYTSGGAAMFSATTYNPDWTASDASRDLRLMHNENGVGLADSQAATSVPSNLIVFREAFNFGIDGQVGFKDFTFTDANLRTSASISSAGEVYKYRKLQISEVAVATGSGASYAHSGSNAAGKVLQADGSNTFNMDHTYFNSDGMKLTVSTLYGLGTYTLTPSVTNGNNVTYVNGSYTVANSSSYNGSSIDPVNTEGDTYMTMQGSSFSVSTSNGEVAFDDRGVITVLATSDDLNGNPNHTSTVESTHSMCIWAPLESLITKGFTNVYVNTSSANGVTLLPGSSFWKGGVAPSLSTNLDFTIAKVPSGEADITSYVDVVGGTVDLVLNNSSLQNSTDTFTLSIQDAVGTTVDVFTTGGDSDKVLRVYTFTPTTLTALTGSVTVYEMASVTSDRDISDIQFSYTGYLPWASGAGFRDYRPELSAAIYVQNGNVDVSSTEFSNAGFTQVGDYNDDTTYGDHNLAVNASTQKEAVYEYTVTANGYSVQSTTSVDHYVASTTTGDDPTYAAEESSTIIVPAPDAAVVEINTLPDAEGATNIALTGLDDTMGSNAMLTNFLDTEALLASRIFVTSISSTASMTGQTHDGTTTGVGLTVEEVRDGDSTVNPQVMLDFSSATFTDGSTFDVSYDGTSVVTVTLSLVTDLSTQYTKVDDTNMTVNFVDNDTNDSIIRRIATALDAFQTTGNVSRFNARAVALRNGSFVGVDTVYRDVMQGDVNRDLYINTVADDTVSEYKIINHDPDSSQSFAVILSKNSEVTLNDNQYYTGAEISYSTDSATADPPTWQNGANHDSRLNVNIAIGEMAIDIASLTADHKFRIMLNENSSDGDIFYINFYASNGDTLQSVPVYVRKPPHPISGLNNTVEASTGDATAAAKAAMVAAESHDDCATYAWTFSDLVEATDHSGATAVLSQTYWLSLYAQVGTDDTTDDVYNVSNLLSNGVIASSDGTMTWDDDYKMLKIVGKSNDGSVTDTFLKLANLPERQLGGSSGAISDYIPGRGSWTSSNVLKWRLAIRVGTAPTGPAFAATFYNIRDSTEPVDMIREHERYMHVHNDADGGEYDSFFTAFGERVVVQYLDATGSVYLGCRFVKQANNDASPKLSTLISGVLTAGRNLYDGSLMPTLADGMTKQQWVDFLASETVGVLTVNANMPRLVPGTTYIDDYTHVSSSSAINGATSAVTSTVDMVSREVPAADA